jgi:glyoxylase-like metal-dependent hydrolase (beta-lactamase superfamily II)
MPRVLLALFGLVLLAFALPGSASAQTAAPTPAPPPPPPVVNKLADDVYVFRQGGYNSLIILTDEGVLTTDPSSQFITGRSATLKDEIAKLTNQPVKWVVFSHNHRDHNEGGHVFADTATFIAQRRAAPRIAARNDARSPVPTMLFDDKLTLTPGGKTIELVHIGSNHSDDPLVLYYPARRIAHAVDFAETARMPFGTLAETTSIDAWVASLRRLETEFDFTTLVTGHTADGNKATVRATQTYFADLQTAIRGARIMGFADNSTFMTDYVRQELAPGYRTWLNFDQHVPQNVQAVLRIWKETSTR